MSKPTLTLKFAEHIQAERVRDMVSGVAAYGNVHSASSDREFVVEIFRPSKLPHLKQKLAEWESWGLRALERPR